MEKIAKYVIIGVVIYMILLFTGLGIFLYLDQNPSSFPTETVVTQPTDPTEEPEKSPITVQPDTPATAVPVVPTPTVTIEPTATPQPTATPEPAWFELHQIDVGCANAHLVRTNQVTIFIDGGQSHSFKHVKTYLEGLGIDHVDVYIATHWDGDHADNMNSIVSTWGDERTMVYGNTVNVSRKYSPLQQGTYKQMVDGDVFTYGELSLKCVGPYELKGTENHKSLNLLFSFGKHEFLITGDFCHSQVLEYPELADGVDVLQFPHHGLKEFCITNKTLMALSPEHVLFPANTSGPGNQLLRSLGMDCQIYNNGKSGNVCFKSDGTILEVTTSKEQQ